MTDEIQAAEVPADDTPPPRDLEAESEARALGWKSPDEWKGEIPSGYIDDPKRYLERAEGFTPFRNIKAKLSELEKSADDRLRRIEKAATAMIERERKTHAEELARIKSEKVQAFEAGDRERFDALERKQEDLQSFKPEPVPEPGMAEVEAWAKDRPWFGTKAAEFDPIMTNAAGVLWGEAAGKGMTDPKQILAYVDKRMEENFPHKFAKAAAVVQKQSAVESGLTFGGGNSGGGFASLPKSARDAFARFVAQGVFTDSKEDRETYFKDYSA